MSRDSSSELSELAEKANLLHQTKGALSICASFQKELRIGMDDLNAELSDRSSWAGARIQPIFEDDIDPCVEYLQETFNCLQERLEIFRNHCTAND